jgi:hypothetical protein
MQTDKTAVVREFLLAFRMMAVNHWNTKAQLLTLVERETERSLGRLNKCRNSSELGTLGMRREFNISA